MKRTLLQLIMLLAMFTSSDAQEDRDHNFEVGKNLEIFNAVIRNLDMMYVDTIDAKKVVSNGINRMLQSLDPYTVYYPDPNELQSFLSGKYAGIGALIRYNLVLDNAVIDEPYENTPAQEAGLKKGDIILSIDDSTMVGKSTSYVSSHLRGDAGTTFLLKFRRLPAARFSRWRQFPTTVCVLTASVTSISRSSPKAVPRRYGALSSA